MTIIHPEAFHRSLPAGFDGVFDWDFLRTAFRGNIEPMDFDGVVERKGSYLVFETKDHGVQIKDGQLRCLNNLLKFGKFTIVFLWGKTPPYAWRWERTRHFSGVQPIPTDAETVWHFAKTWFDLVDADKCAADINQILSTQFGGRSRP